MGMLVYNGRMTLTIDDRVLAHLQVVVINKLRRRESFTFTCEDGTQEAVCWMGPSIPLEFVYSGNRRPLLNREWLELMAMSANSNSGLDRHAGARTDDAHRRTRAAPAAVAVPGGRAEPAGTTEPDAPATRAGARAGRRLSPSAPEPSRDRRRLTPSAPGPVSA